MKDFKSSLENKLHVKLMDQHEEARLFLIKKPKDMTLSTLTTKLAAISGFEYLVPNVKFRMVSSLSDPLYSQQWAMEKIATEKAWDLETNKEPIVVAVIDTGVDYRHQDLKDQMLRDSSGELVGWNFFDNNKDPIDVTSSANPGHGTHCSGIIAAVANNSMGVAGVAQNVRLMPLRFIGADGSGDLMNAIKAIDFAISHHADIISASWGATVPRDQVKPLLEAIERAKEKGIFFVAAAANDGASNDKTEVYPANAGFDNMISVAASDKDDKKPSWSNFGRYTVDLSSPGADILSTLPSDKYGKLSGTSMATPLVAGLAALLLGQARSQGKNYSASEIKAIMQSSGSLVDIETACGCRIAADGAMSSLVGNKLVLVPNAFSIEPGDQKAFHAIGGHGSFRFSSSDDKIASVTADGALKAIADGEVTVKVVDGDGHEALSRSIHVGKKPASGGGGGGTMECPLPNPQLCDLMCVIMPSLPWCKK